MRRYIVLLLITGIVWAQTDFDTLVLKSGATYVGEFSTIDGDNVFFKPKGASDFLSISIKQIQTLEIKDGQFVIGEGSYEQLSGYEKRINEMKNSTTFNNCLGIVGLYLLTVIIMFLVNPYR